MHFESDFEFVFWMWSSIPKLIYPWNCWGIGALLRLKYADSNWCIFWHLFSNEIGEIPLFTIFRAVASLCEELKNFFFKTNESSCIFEINAGKVIIFDDNVEVAVPKSE